MSGSYPKDYLAWLQRLDGADLGRNVLNPDSLKLVPQVDSVRPGGVACTLKAGTDGPT